MRSLLKSPKIALKYCGGCNPSFDRAEYVQKIKSAAEGIIEWSNLDDGKYEKILLILGCATECLKKNFDLLEKGIVVSISNNDQNPDKIVKQLLSEDEE